jgi:hypothetical protein
MKLEKWALIAEIVGALAIVISLAFVGVQLQANTSATRSATASAASFATSTWYNAMGTSAQASALFYNFMNDPASLTPEERLQAVFAVHGILVSFQTSFMLANEGTLDAQIKDTILEAVVVVKDRPGFKYYWEQRRAFFYEEFQEYVEQLMKVERATSNDIFSYSDQQEAGRTTAED